MKRVKETNINTLEHWDHEWAHRPPEIAERFRVVARILRDMGVHTVLDIGCGDGTGYNVMKSSMPGVTYFGTDFSGVAIDHAKKEYPDAHFALAEFNAQPFDPSSFDAVISQEVIEHLDEPLALLAEMRRLSRDVIIVTTPWGDEMGDLSEHVWEFMPEDFEKVFNAGTGWTLSCERYAGTLLIAVARRLA